MAKIGLTKLGLKKNSNLLTFSWNEQVIEVKEYLPVEEKTKIIETIIKNSLDENSFASPIKIKISFILEVIQNYTNINFTDKQKENTAGLYDLIVGSKFWDALYDFMKDNTDIEELSDNLDITLKEMQRHKDSVLGVLEAVNEDYNNTSFDINSIAQTLEDPTSLSLLKDVITKLG